MKAYHGSKSPQIIALHKNGVAARDIAREVGCSHQNVIRVLRHYTRWSGRVEALPDAMRQWLIAEAERSRVTPEVMARALLVDAINEAMEKSR